ncbi:MAG TPA: DNA internalization-related competence protein ComEC/Rec2 [Vicinamibacterales bacterium]|nr:DNA internalization-related competence protein ComEC/Rec2 [Vicinamibacterales bacterium]
MSSVGVIPALSLVAGILVALASPWDAWVFLVPMLAAIVVATVAWSYNWPRVTTAALIAGFAACGAASGAQARERALDTTLRRVLDAEHGGFALSSLGPGGPHAPVPTRARINEDAALRDGFVSLTVDVRAIRVGDDWRDVSGGAVLSVSGATSGERASEWRAGRTIEAPVTFRRRARYLNDGVPDFEQDLALDGTTLLGTVKSALLVEIVERGTWLDELAAASRARIRRAIERWVGRRNPTSAALVTAVLIGDRAAIPDEVREQLQISGTYHVIAISGGNIAVFVVLVSALCRGAGLGPRAAAVLTLAVLLAYAAVVVSGPSVRRAVMVAVLYLGARAVDHRAPAWQAAAMACAGLLVVWPLDLRDVGFVLTFGAASALLALASATRRSAAPAPVRWLLQSIGASLAVEAVLLPVQAIVFAQVSLAGIVLNLAAVPAMTVGQLAGLAVVAGDLAGMGASVAAWAADAGVRLLLGAASLAEAAPWVTGRAPPPPWAVVALYYAALAVACRGPRRARAAGAVVCVATAVVIAFGGFAAFWRRTPQLPEQLRLTVLDVGQAEAILLEPPGGLPVLVDAGGSPFGSRLDIGRRVVAPALWARDVTRLSTLVITHGDPDHLGGAPGVLASMPVGDVWFGIRVPRHAAGNELLADLDARRVGVRYVRGGRTMTVGRARLRVLHPPEPDWERPRVRNDDSVVVEVVYGDVAVLLAGDISAEVERALAPQLTPAPIRVLKVAHHGSRTSTSQELLDAWRPQLAVISAGRGNAFGHPTRDVLDRLDRAGARVLRTDRDGQITIDTDGRSLRWKTFRRGGRL